MTCAKNTERRLESPLIPLKNVMKRSLPCSEGSLSLLPELEEKERRLLNTPHKHLSLFFMQWQRGQFLFFSQRGEHKVIALPYFHWRLRFVEKIQICTGNEYFQPKYFQAQFVLSVIIRTTVKVNDLRYIPLVYKWDKETSNPSIVFVGSAFFRQELDYQIQ